MPTVERKGGNDRYNGSFGRGSSLQKEPATSQTERTPHVEHIGTTPNSASPIQTGQNGVHYDEAAARPSIPKAGPSKF